MKKTSLFILLSIGAFCQKKDSIIIQSSPLIASYEATTERLKLLAPNVAAIEQQGNIPINYSTGQLNYAVPLHEIAVDNLLTIPIKLHYSNSGLKPEQVPTWVGHGWDLPIGGTIVQYINGLDDFGSTGLSNTYIQQDLANYFNGSMVNPDKYYYAKAVEEGAKDAQYDTFSFNFLNKSGKFYFDNGVATLFNYQALKITYNNEHFVLIDEMGYQYIFAYSQISSGNFSDGFLYSNTDPLTVGTRTWYLTQIMSPSGVEINFSYVPDIDYQINADGKSYWMGADEVNGNCNTTNSFTYLASSSSSTISQALLSQISWKGKKVVFETSPRNDLVDINNNKAKALSKIIVYNESNEVVRKIGFEYSYFNNNDRLKLNNVAVLANNSTNKEIIHTFEYYEMPGQSVPIPSLLTLSGKIPENHSIDHWKYFNGKANASKIPKNNYSTILPNASSDFGDADRNADGFFSKIGMLKKIIYPTKGFTSIEYEPNTIVYDSYNDVPLFLKNLSTITYTNHFTSSVANCNNTPIVGQVTVNQAIAGAKITWALETSSLDDVSRFTFKVTGSSSYLIDDYSQPYKEVLLFADLPAGTYDYTLEAGCVSFENVPTAQAYFVIEKPNTPTGQIEVQLGGNRVSRIIDFGSPIGTNDRYITYQQANLLDMPFYISAIESGKGSGGALNPCVFCGNKYFLGENNVYNWDGFHLEYKKVTESYGVNAQNGKKIYNYDGNYFVGGPLGVSPYPSSFNLNWRSGNLTNQETYSNNSGFSLVHKLSNTYTPTNFYPITKNGLKIGKKQTCPNGTTISPIDNLYYNYAIMPVFTDKYATATTTNIEYFDGLDLVNTIAYSYNNDWLLNKISTINSKNQTEETLTYYASDYNNSANSSLAQMKQKHIIGMPLKIVKTTNGNITEGVLLNSDNVGNITEIYTYEQASLLPYSHNPNTYFDINYSLYGSRKYSSSGNLVESIARKQAPITYIWAYKHTYPIATVANATKAEVENIVGSLENIAELYTEADILNIENQIRSNLPNAQINSGIINSGIGLKQLTATNGLKNTFMYDIVNRLLSTKDNQGSLVEKYSYQYGL